MKIFKITLLIVTLSVAGQSYSQVTAPTNLPIAGHYVGFDGSSLIPLPIRNDGPFPIEFHTNGIPHATIDQFGNAGFGTMAPTAKMHITTDQPNAFPTASLTLRVTNTAPGLSLTHGINVSLEGLSQDNVGVYAEVEGIVLRNSHTAGRFVTRNRADFLRGVWAEVYPNNIGESPNDETIALDGFVGVTPGVETARTYGVRGVTTGNGFSANYGVYGEVQTTGPNDYAGYFNGDVFTTGDYLPSDESLKEEVNAIESASATLMALNPVSYKYVEGRLKAGDQTQYGFIAQELEEVLPELVGSSSLPASYDSTGAVVEEGLDIKAVRYNDLIAILVAAYQEQNQAIQSKEESLEAMQEQLEAQAAQISALETSLAQAIASIEMAKSDMDHCCKGKPAASIGPASGKVELDQNVPNPFSDQTRIDFHLPQDAHVRLVISDSQGRVLETLVDSQQPAGPHTTTWDGSRYSPGMYYYSLFADGQLLTKKMIKR